MDKVYGPDCVLPVSGAPAWTWCGRSLPSSSGGMSSQGPHGAGGEARSRPRTHASAGKSQGQEPTVGKDPLQVTGAVSGSKGQGGQAGGAGGEDGGLFGVWLEAGAGSAGWKARQLPERRPRRHPPPRRGSKRIEFTERSLRFQD